jgi:hypothetical protein
MTDQSQCGGGTGCAHVHDAEHRHARRDRSPGRRARALRSEPLVSETTSPVLDAPPFRAIRRIASSVSRFVVKLVVVVATALSACPAGAATFNVDTTVDDVAKTACDDGVADDCSLRGAVSRANAAPDQDDIVLPAGQYALTVAAPCTFKAIVGENALTLSSVVLCLNSDVSITGAGAAETVIAGNAVAKVIAVSAAKTVAISGVTVRDGGETPLTFQSGGGAGIMNHGTLTLSDSIVTANLIGNQGGAGLYNVGTMTVLRSLITRNFASGQGTGGGILNVGSGSGGGFLSVVDSTISDNVAGLGGGIFNYSSTSRAFATISGSTVSGNSAVTLGGGINNYSFSTLTVINSTISGNRADSGAGIDNAFTIHLRNVTITANIAGSAASGRGIGGGIQNLDGGTATLQNTIIAGNTAYQLGPDCHAFAGRGAALLSQGHNLIQNTADCDITGDLTGNLVGQAPQLGLLVDNGGRTATHAPSDGSPVVDAGSPDAPGSGDGACAATDQRGFVRPLGAKCDIGAVERSEGFAVVRILPSAGGDVGSVSAIVSGNGFVDGATVKLARAGQPDIAGDPVQVDAGGSAIAATFDLAGKPTGPWDVVVSNLDGTSTTLPAGFTVEEGRAPQLWVNVVGRFFRPGRPSKLTIFYGNRGNVDAFGVPFSLSLPDGYDGRRFFVLAPPPVQSGQARSDWSQVPVTVDLDAPNGFIDIPLLLPVVPAGFTGMLQIGLTLPPGAQDSALLATIGDPLLESELAPQTVADAVAGAKAFLESMGDPLSPTVVAELEAYAAEQFRLIQQSGLAATVGNLGTQVHVYSLSQLHFDLALFGVVRAAAGARSAAVANRVLALLSHLGPAGAQAQQQPCPVYKKGDGLKEGCSGGGGPDEPFLPPEIPEPPGCNRRDPSTVANCKLTPAHCEAMAGYKVDGDACVPRRPGKNCSKLGTPNPVAGNDGCIHFPLKPKDSIDPNDKVGTLGATAAGHLRDTTSLAYLVNFENLETATAPAQVVAVTDQLDVQTIDLDTFSLGPISFADSTLVPASGMKQYTGGVDLRPEQNLLVTVQAGLDETTGLVTWLFTSIDPDTGQLTDDPDAGFLAPNVASPEGEGSVAFTVRPKANVADGATIANQASIVFDTNAPIETNVWTNVIDRSAPSSTVTAEQIGCSTDLALAWSGSDAGAGVGTFTILVSENGGPATVWRDATTDTSGTFAGQAGKTYAFHSVATDLVGNVEDAPGAADATVTIADCSGHDLAVTKIQAPPGITLKPGKPPVTKIVKVEIQNRSRHAETIPNLATLGAMVDLQVESLGTCPTPIPTLLATKPQTKLPRTLKPKQKLAVAFSVTIGCANDPAKGAGHEDYRFTARIDRTPLGAGDAHPTDDVCPRQVAPPGARDPFPDGKILDRGCGGKKQDRTKGAPVLLDARMASR